MRGELQKNICLGKIKIGTNIACFSLTKATVFVFYEQTQAPYMIMWI